MPFRIFFSLLCFNFIYFFKYETIVHWVPQFFMHNKLFLWVACVLCSNYRKSHAKLAFVIPAGLLPCIYVTESALRIPRSQKKGVILLVELQEVSVYATPARIHSISGLKSRVLKLPWLVEFQEVSVCAIRRCSHFHQFSWESWPIKIQNITHHSR